MLLARMCWEIQHPKPCAQDTGIQTKLINWKLQTISVRSLHSILIACLLKSQQTGESWGKKSLWIPLIFFWTHFTQHINQIHHELAPLVVARIVINSSQSDKTYMIRLYKMLHGLMMLLITAIQLQWSGRKGILKTLVDDVTSVNVFTKERDRSSWIW
jgi:hypothetical protein